MGFTPEQLILLYWLTILIIIVKFVLVGFLAVRLYQHNKVEPIKITDFYVGVLILIVALGVSRIFYFYFDFYLTQFDTAFYLVNSNIWYWRIGSVISGLGAGILLVIVEKRILENKTKGILGVIVGAVAILHLFYPLNTLNDFTTLSTIGMVSGIALLIVPIIFLWLGIKDPGNRKVPFLIALGGFLYATAGLLWSESFLGPLEAIYGPDIRTFFIIATIILRIIGLSILASVSTKLKI